MGKLENVIKLTQSQARTLINGSSVSGKYWNDFDLFLVEGTTIIDEQHIIRSSTALTNTINTSTYTHTILFSNGYMLIYGTRYLSSVDATLTTFTFPYAFADKNYVLNIRMGASSNDTGGYDEFQCVISGTGNSSWTDGNGNTLVYQNGRTEKGFQCSTTKTTSERQYHYCAYGRTNLTSLH